MRKVIAAIHIVVLEAVSVRIARPKYKFAASGIANGSRDEIESTRERLEYGVSFKKN